MQGPLLFLVHHGLQPQPILGSICRNCFCFLISFLDWRTPNRMPVRQVWIHRCQIERNNQFPWPASCMCADVSSCSLLQGDAADSWSQSVPSANIWGCFVPGLWLCIFACIEFHNVSVIPFLLSVTCESGVGTAPSKWQNSSWSQDPVTDQSRSWRDVSISGLWTAWQ